MDTVTTISTPQDDFQSEEKPKKKRLTRDEKIAKAKQAKNAAERRLYKLEAAAKKEKRKADTREKILKGVFLDILLSQGISFYITTTRQAIDIKDYIPETFTKSEKEILLNSLAVHKHLFPQVKK